MFQKIKDWCERCERCCFRKTPTAGVRALLVSIHTSAPMELLCVDFLTLQKSKGGTENVLIVTDHFSRFAQAYPTKDQEQPEGGGTERVVHRNLLTQCMFLPVECTLKGTGGEEHMDSEASGANMKSDSEDDLRMEGMENDQQEGAEMQEEPVGTVDGVEGGTGRC
ncbi:hypothetical protein LDENG_00201750 [Lucifuga dentata]|nr:hypothetical protein LDENG_00201750 [Lucifuga dentata]